jgi:hypothetical protein
MEIQTQEARIILVIEAIRTSKKLSHRAAAEIYKVPESTLRDKITGRPSRLSTRPNRYNLTELEKEVVFRHILDINSRRFAPRLAGMEDITNYILESRAPTCRKALGVSICTTISRV